MYRVLLSLILLFEFSGYAQGSWQAPTSSQALKNPYSNDAASIMKGQKTFQSLCVACHGQNGEGDGIAAAGLTPKPTDFTTADFQKQTEGEIFWKLSKGKGVMASYEGMLSEEDRWAIITYLKSLNVKKKEVTPASNAVTNTFFFTQLTNTQTTEVLPKGASEFTIQHRFGATELNDSFIKDFLGTDLASNVRFAYAMAINEKMYAEIGRTKYGKVYDLGLKYRFLQQTLDNKHPVNIAVYANTGISTADFPRLVEGSTFESGEVFEYSFAHRLSYNAQVIVSRKFSDKFSMQIAPVMIWRNLVQIEEEQLNMALPIGARLRLNNKSALLLEMTPKLLASDKQIPLALTYEIASSSAHAFQIVLASTDGILEQNIYTSPIYDYSKGKFVLGFNIKRLF